MSVRVYEGGTEGGIDGTEVSVLHFDAGILATGEQKNVTKVYSLRTDGEVIRDAIIRARVISENNLVDNDDGVGHIVERDEKLKDFLNDRDVDSYTRMIMIKELNETNKNIKFTITVYQVSGTCDVRAKIFVVPLIDTIEVVN